MQDPELLSDIAVFVAVVSGSTFTAAADRLAISKSMVSKCVNRLESKLGARLLHRTTRRLRLTEAGTALYETSHAALAQIDDAQLAVSRLQGSPRGLLKVSSSPAFGSEQLPAVVRELADAYPDLSVELILDDRHVDLVREGIDVALRITSEAPDSDMVYRRLCRNRQVVCAAPGYLARRGVPRTPQELAVHECIAHTARATPRIWHFTTPTGGKLSVKVSGRIAISSALALRRAAVEGLGIIELNSYLVGPEIVAGRLVRLLEDHEPRELSIYAVFPQRRYLAPKVRVFIDALLARVTPEPLWDAFLEPPAALPQPSLPDQTQRARSPAVTAEGGKSRRGNARMTRPGSRASRR